MNPLTKARSGVGRGWRRATGAVRDAAASARDGVEDAAEWSWDRSGVPRLIHSARTNPRVAIAWAAAVVVVIGWIAWTVYVTAEHGANAGLGVLISWPALFAALAIVGAPFVAAALAVRRRRGGGPQIAGGADVGADSADTETMTGGTYPG